MRSILGEGYWVVEEGLGGRTTVWDDPVEGENRNGKTYLLPCLLSHMPLDLVVMMLGTNNLKSRFGQTASDIAYSAGTLVDIIQRSQTGPDGTAPQVLLICPAPVAKLTLFADMFEGAVEKSRQLARFYQRTADIYGCAFLNAGQFITSSDGDGIHLEADAQRTLGQVVAEKVKQMLG
jgi:lysophospholipase L1-like esterase